MVTESALKQQYGKAGTSGRTMASFKPHDQLHSREQSPRYSFVWKLIGSEKQPGRGYVTDKWAAVFKLAGSHFTGSTLSTRYWSSE
jgi:hypothetical protein